MPKGSTKQAIIKKWMKSTKEQRNIEANEHTCSLPGSTRLTNLYNWSLVMSLVCGKCLCSSGVAYYNKIGVTMRQGCVVLLG